MNRTRATLTAGELLTYLASVPADAPVTINMQDVMNVGAGYANMLCVYSDDSGSVVVDAVDDFDPRQF